MNDFVRFDKEHLPNLPEISWPKHRFREDTQHMVLARALFKDLKVFKGGLSYKKTSKK